MGTVQSTSGVLNNMLRLSILCVTALSCSANNPVKTSVKSQLHQNKDVVKSRISDAKLSLNSAQDQFNKTILSKFNNADLQKYGIQGSSEMQGLGDGACGLIIECDLNLFSSDDPPPASNSNSNSRSATELQGLGGGDCGLIFLCDLGPLDCNEALKLECALGNDNEDSETQKNVQLATEQVQLQGLGDGGASRIVLECDIGPFICGIKIKFDLGSD